MCCEYCSKGFTEEDPKNYYLLRIKDNEKNLAVCRSCLGCLLGLTSLVESVKLYKITSYTFPKDSIGNKKDYTRGLPASLRKQSETSRILLVKDSKKEKIKKVIKKKN